MSESGTVTSDRADYLAAWRAAHPQERRQHAAKENARRRQDPTCRAARHRAEKDRQKRRNVESSLGAAHLFRIYTEDEDRAILSGRTAADVAREIGRTRFAVEKRRYRLRQRAAGADLVL